MEGGGNSPGVPKSAALVGKLIWQVKKGEGRTEQPGDVLMRSKNITDNKPRAISISSPPPSVLLLPTIFRRDVLKITCKAAVVLTHLCVLRRVLTEAQTWEGRMLEIF